jgi:hypothetical protein
MTQQPIHQFLGWLGHLWSAADTRTQARLAKREACIHGEDDPCPFSREDFDCNDCDIDEGSGQMMPRI